MRSIITAATLLYAASAVAQSPVIQPQSTEAKPNDGHVLITKMLEHAERNNYEGTFVFMHNGRLDSMRIVHGVVDGVVKERLTSLSGEPREVVRDDETVTCVWPMRKLVTVDPSSANHGIPSIVPKELESLTKNYTVIPGPISRNAQLDCKVLAIKPVDQFRYGYELCIEPESGMLLRSKMIHPSEMKVLEEVMFTSVKFLDSVDHVNFHPENDIENFTWSRSRRMGESDVSGQDSDKSWKVSKLPPGFSVSKISQRLMSTSDEPVHHMVVTDGVASVSVFIIKPRNLGRMFEGLSRRGSINAFSRGIDDHQITVLGEVPNETVQMIGSSIVHDQPQIKMGEQ